MYLLLSSVASSIAVAQRNAVEAQTFRLTERQFDQMVFGTQRWVPVANGGQILETVEHPTDADFRNRMEIIATTEIRLVDGAASLTDAQRKKLQLAARGDMAEHIRRAAELRPKLTAKSLDEHRFYELLIEMKPLVNGQTFGVFGDDSLVWKILQRIVTDEQRVRLRSMDREQQKRIIESALLNCEQTANRFVLTGETRRKFAELILEHGRVPRTVGQYGQFIVLLEANLLRDRVKPLLSESEWEKFEWQVGLAKRFEPELEGLGLWSARRSEPSEESEDGAKD